MWLAKVTRLRAQVRIVHLLRGRRRCARRERRELVVFCLPCVVPILLGELGQTPLRVNSAGGSGTGNEGW